MQWFFPIIFTFRKNYLQVVQIIVILYPNTKPEGTMKTPNWRKRFDRLRRNIDKAFGYSASWDDVAARVGCTRRAIHYWRNGKIPHRRMQANIETVEDAYKETK